MALRSNAAAPPTAQVLTEGRIKATILDDLRQAATGDSVDLVMFYLADRDVIAELKAAHARGAVLRVLLDPNKDAFGRTKNGIPNRQVANELHRRGIAVRWSDTHGEQAHAKMLLVRRADGRCSLNLGSANLTRRNLDDLNLETNICIRGRAADRVFADAKAYVDLLWNNAADRHFSVDYSAYAEDSTWRTVRYRIMEATGLSSF